MIDVMIDVVLWVCAVFLAILAAGATRRKDYGSAVLLGLLSILAGIMILK